MTDTTPDVAPWPSVSYLTVRWRLARIIADSSDADLDPDWVPVSGLID